MATLYFRSGNPVCSRPSRTALATRDVMAAPGLLALRPMVTGIQLTLGRMGLTRLAFGASGMAPGVMAVGTAPTMTGEAIAPTIMVQGE